jgi:hypothetical protein
MYVYMYTCSVHLLSYECVRHHCGRVLLKSNEQRHNGSLKCVAVTCSASTRHPSFSTPLQCDQHTTPATSRHFTSHITINIALHIFKNRATNIKKIINRQQNKWTVSGRNRKQKRDYLKHKKCSTSLLSASSPISETELVCLMVTNLRPFVLVTAKYR